MYDSSLHNHAICGWKFMKAIELIHVSRIIKKILTLPLLTLFRNTWLGRLANPTYCSNFFAAPIVVLTSLILDPSDVLSRLRMLESRDSSCGPSCLGERGVNGDGGGEDEELRSGLASPPISSDPVREGRHFSFRFRMKAAALAMGLVFFILLRRLFSSPLIGTCVCVCECVGLYFYSIFRHPGTKSDDYFIGRKHVSI